MATRTFQDTERALARVGAERVLLTHERDSLTASIARSSQCVACGHPYPCSQVIEAKSYLRSA